MASTYVNDLRLNELATGDGSGTWGTTTNTNLELIAEGLSFGTEGITTNADTHTSTVADGSTDPARSMFIKYTGTLDSACTITIAPNTISRVHFIENGTSGSQNIIIKQGSGATVTIAPGDVKVVYLDGAGSGAAVVDAFASLSVAVLNATDGCTITTADNTTQLTLTSTDADASEGPRLDLRRNSSSPADDDVLGTIRYKGENDADEDLVYAEIEAQAKDVSDGTEDSELRFFVRRAGDLKEAMMLGPTSVVFNEGSADVNFRVEGNGEENLLFVDAGNDRVGIGTSSPGTSLTVDCGAPGSADKTISEFQAESTRKLGFVWDDSASTLGLATLTNNSLAFHINGNSSEKMRVTSDGITFNGDSAAANALSDYEEGTWTPAGDASSGTSPSFAASSGQYTKIGRLVTINASITNITAGGTSNAQIQVTGLPFTPDVGDGFGACNFGHVTITDSTGVVAVADASEDRIIFMMNRTGAGRTAVDNQHIDSGVSDALFTISYITNQ